MSLDGFALCGSAASALSGERAMPHYSHYPAISSHNCDTSIGGVLQLSNNAMNYMQASMQTEHLGS